MSGGVILTYYYKKPQFPDCARV